MPSSSATTDPGTAPAIPKFPPNVFFSTDGYAATLIVFLVLTWLTLIIRCYIRLKLLRAFTLDDKLIVVAQSLLTAYGVVNYRLLVVLDLFSRPFLMHLYISQQLYPPTVVFAKLSIAVFLGRIVVERSHKIIIWFVAALTVVFSMIYFFVQVFQCHPVRKAWDITTSGHCFPTDIITNFTYTNSAVCILTDSTLAVLPIVVVNALPIRRREKIMAVLILAVGSLASIATIVRVPYLHGDGTKHPSLPKLAHSLDDITLWSFLEPAIGIFAANLGTFRPLLRRLPFFRPKYSPERPFGNPVDPNQAVRAGERLYPTISTGLDLNSSHDDDKDAAEQNGHDVEKGSNGIAISLH